MIGSKLEEEVKKALEKELEGYEDKRNALTFLERALEYKELGFFKGIHGRWDVWLANKRRCKHVFIPTKYYIKKDWEFYRKLKDVFLYEDQEERRCIKCGIDYFSGRE